MSQIQKNKTLLTLLPKLRHRISRIHHPKINLVHNKKIRDHRIPKINKEILHPIK